MQGEARLRGLHRIIYSKTISPRLWNAKPACAGYTGIITDPTAKTHRRDAEDAEISINRSLCLLRRCSDMTFLQQTHYSKTM
jgi:hypothetical protein